MKASFNAKHLNNSLVTLCPSIIVHPFENVYRVTLLKMLLLYTLRYYTYKARYPQHFVTWKSHFCTISYWLGGWCGGPSTNGLSSATLFWNQKNAVDN